MAHLVLEEFPQSATVPTIQEVDESLTANHSVEGEHDDDVYLYQIGDFVERLGDDMVWHFEPIRRIVEFDDKPGEIFYRLGSGILVGSKEVRCSEEAIRRHFGMRPHLWQQWALLKLEQYARFQYGHERDFEEISYLAMQTTCGTNG